MIRISYFRDGSIKIYLPSSGCSKCLQNFRKLAHQGTHSTSIRNDLWPQWICTEREATPAKANNCEPAVRCRDVFLRTCSNPAVRPVGNGERAQTGRTHRPDVKCCSAVQFCTKHMDRDTMRRNDICLQTFSIQLRLRNLVLQRLKCFASV